jgi:excisionase family DNA binding protein
MHATPNHYAYDPPAQASSTSPSKPPLTSAAQIIGLDPLLDVGQLAAYLGIPVSTLYDWRTRGLGPPAYRLGKHLKFSVADVREWMAGQRDPAVPPEPTPHSRG